MGRRAEISSSRLVQAACTFSMAAAEACGDGAAGQSAISATRSPGLMARQVSQGVLCAGAVWWRRGQSSCRYLSVRMRGDSVGRAVACEEVTYEMWQALRLSLRESLRFLSPHLKNARNSPLGKSFPRWTGQLRVLRTGCFFRTRWEQFWRLSVYPLAEKKTEKFASTRNYSLRNRNGFRVTGARDGNRASSFLHSLDVRGEFLEHAGFLAAS